MTSPRRSGTWLVAVAVTVVVVAVCAASVATLWPLLAYSTSLAVFGLPHVLTELRYVDARFGRRFATSLWWRLGVTLAAIVGVRALVLARVVDASVAVVGELALVALLLVCAWPATGRGSARLLVIGASVAVIAGALFAPVPTLLTFSVLHNATPMGFVVERAPRERRARTALAASLLFFGVPLVVATGAPAMALRAFLDLDRSCLPTGPLVDHFAVYLPASLHHDAVAAQLFSAAVTAQLLHYAAVIVWLPRTLHEDERGRLPWPRWSTFVVVVAACTALLLMHFAHDFKGARALYGLAAAVHAWVEWPVLLVALTSAASSASSSSTSASSINAAGTSPPLSAPRAR